MNRTVFSLPERYDYRTRGGLAVTRLAEQFSGGATRLDTLIEALPAPLREVVVLRELQELGYREIAEVTGVPIGTVMSRLHRARSALRRAWACWSSSAFCKAWAAADCIGTPKRGGFCRAISSCSRTSPTVTGQNSSPRT